MISIAVPRPILAVEALIARLLKLGAKVSLRPLRRVILLVRLQWLRPIVAGVAIISRHLPARRMDVAVDELLAALDHVALTLCLHVVAVMLPPVLSAFGLLLETATWLEVDGAHLLLVRSRNDQVFFADMLVSINPVPVDVWVTASPILLLAVVGTLWEVWLAPLTLSLVRILPRLIALIVSTVLLGLLRRSLGEAACRCGLLPLILVLPLPLLIHLATIWRRAHRLLLLLLPRMRCLLRLIQAAQERAAAAKARHKLAHIGIEDLVHAVQKS